MVEIIVAKVEINHYVQFLLLPQCLQMSQTEDVSQCVCKWERVKWPQIGQRAYAAGYEPSRRKPNIMTSA